MAIPCPRGFSGCLKTFINIKKRRRVGLRPTTDTAGVVIGWASQPTTTPIGVAVYRSGCLKGFLLLRWARMPTLRRYSFKNEIPPKR
ncbi:MAG: hypothetical protein IKX14_00790 [Neisseriaceae bacterium]|nr:hypothetical protein [Neisseriaceae bacterium]